MSLMRPGSHRSAPIQMLIVGLLLIAGEAYYEAGPDAVDHALRGSLEKLLIQVPAGIVAVFLASRLIESDFGPIGVVALKLAAITVLAEGVSCWVQFFVPFRFFSFMAELTVLLVGFFWLFELGKWETWLVVALNFAVLAGAHWLMANYFESHRSVWSSAWSSDRPQGEKPGRARRRGPAPRPSAPLIRIE